MGILTAQTELTAPAAGDYLHIVDVSNTTDNAAGSSMKITLQNLTARSPDSLAVTATSTITETQILINEFISNYGAISTIALTLPAVSYRVTQTFLIESNQIIELVPPSGESFDLSGATLTVNQTVDSPAVELAKLVTTRMRLSTGWIWSLDIVRGLWVAG